MQGLQEIWGLSQEEFSWATAGYQGAISSGQTTCGLLIGSSVAIGLRFGRGKKCIPKEDEKQRNKAIKAVNELYKDFISQYKNTECITLIGCDLSKPEDQARYFEKEIYKDTCFEFYNFVMNRFIEMDKQEEM